MAKGTKSHDFLEPNKDEESDSAKPTKVETELYSFPADYTLELITSKLDKGEVQVPPFQRHYVWSKEKASMLIDSFVRRLPVPPVYLFAQKDRTFLIIDGHQRLITIKRFLQGKWQRREDFRLALEEGNPLKDKRFKDLPPETQRQLKDWVLRAIVIEPKREEYRDAMYDIFSRLNTGGVNLLPQEIRNSAFHGSFNTSLKDLNKVFEWRKIIGVRKEDPRMRDVELVLRGLALSRIGQLTRSGKPLKYTASLKQFLNDFMTENQNPTEKWLRENETLFKNTIHAILKELGNKPFHLRHNKMNAPAYDAVFVAFSRHSESIPPNMLERWEMLKSNKNFQSDTGYRPTGSKSVNGRIKIAERILFGS